MPPPLVIRSFHIYLLFRRRCVSIGACHIQSVTTSTSPSTITLLDTTLYTSQSIITNHSYQPRTHYHLCSNNYGTCRLWKEASAIIRAMDPPDLVRHSHVAHHWRCWVDSKWSYSNSGIIALTPQLFFIYTPWPRYEEGDGTALNKFSRPAFLLLVFLPTWPALVVMEILFSQVYVRNVWDVTNAIIASLFSCFGALLFTELLYMVFRRLFGRHDGTNGNYNNILLTKTGFGHPSAQAAVAFASLIFLFLYLNAKLKVWSNYRSSLLKMLCLFYPLFLAAINFLTEVYCLHHGYRPFQSALLGALIGTFFAFASYRMAYGSLFNYRLNHM